MRTLFILLLILTSMALSASIDLYKAAEYDIGHAIGQCRAIPVESGEKKHILLIHSKDAEIDPYIGMFFFPRSTTKLTLINSQGEEIWNRDMGPGMVSGIWFLPVFSFDLDQNGNDEIWLVNNSDPEHPMDFRKYVLQRLDGVTGEIIGEYPWPKVPEKQSMSHKYRNFILGGYVKDEPVLVTAQGTYGPMQLQGWNADMSQRWEVNIAAERERRTGIEPFTFHALTGEPYPLDFNPYTTIPVDLNGDDVHELVKGYFEGDGSVLDRNGNNLGNIGGLAAMACKFIDHPGEQILSYSHETGTVCIWADRNADDNEIAKERYRNPFYYVNKRLTACGYNLFNLGGL